MATISYEPYWRRNYIHILFIIIGFKKTVYKQTYVYTKEGKKPKKKTCYKMEITSEQQQKEYPDDDYIDDVMQFDSH